MGTNDLTATQAAEVLGVTSTAVGHLIRRGVLPARRFGPLYMLRRADVLAYQARRAGKGKPGPRPRSQTAPDAA